MDAMTAKLFYVEITGKRRDTETVMRRLEGGDWKSISNGNSLVAYPTARPVLKERCATVMWTSTLTQTHYS